MSLESEFSGAVRCRGLINKVRAAGKPFFQDRNIQTAKLSHFGFFLVVCVTVISSTWPIIILSLRLRSVIISFKSLFLIQLYQDFGRTHSYVSLLPEPFECEISLCSGVP